MLTNYNGYDMLKSSRRRTHAIIFILFVFFSVPIQGIAQTKEKKIDSKEHNNKNQLSPKILPKKENNIPVVKKNVKTKKLSSNLEKTSSGIKDLKNKLLLVTTQLATAKESDTQKGIEIKKLKSESAKFTARIKALEKNLSLAKTELEGMKVTDAKKSEEIIKLNENVNYLLDSIDEQEVELAFQSSVSEKYKQTIKCYRSALFTWNNLISRQGLTPKEYLVVSVELRRSLFACPPI